MPQGKPYLQPQQNQVQIYFVAVSGEISYGRWCSDGKHVLGPLET